MRPSRVDVAFDFCCSSELVPELVADHAAVQEHCEVRGIQADGVSGAGGVFTRYIGSRKSDAFVRIYRKDKQNEILGELLGPVLRVELVMRNDLARAWWRVWDESKERAYAAAAGHVERLSRLTGKVEVLETTALGDKHRTLDVQLPGGTGDLFKWSNGKPWALRSDRAHLGVASGGNGNTRCDEFKRLQTMCKQFRKVSFTLL